MRYGYFGGAGRYFLFGSAMDSLGKALDNSSGSHHNLYNIVVLSADSKAQTNGKVRPCNDNGSLP